MPVASQEMQPITKRSSMLHDALLKMQALICARTKGLRGVGTPGFKALAYIVPDVTQYQCTQKPIFQLRKLFFCHSLIAFAASQGF